MNYTTIRKNAANSITKNGKAITIRIPAGLTTYNPIAGSGATTPAVDYACCAVEVLYRQAERDGVIIQQSDRKFLVSGLITDGTALPLPANNWKLITGSTTLQIVSVEPLNPADVIILYTVQCRG